MDSKQKNLFLYETWMKGKANIIDYSLTLPDIDGFFSLRLCTAMHKAIFIWHIIEDKWYYT